MASTDAKPVPQKNVAYRITFPIFDADGDLVTGATGLDSEVSKDAGTFADCTNEATEIATSSGMYYLDLTSTEMNADTVAIIVKTSSSGAKTTPIVLYPEEAGDIRVNVTTWLGTACSTPTVAGVPNVNVKTWNDLTTVALPLVPTTAGRTLDVSAGGEAGIDWANVGSPTTSLALTGTTIATTQKVDIETIKTNPVVNAGTVTFPTTATLASTTNITAGTITTATNVTTVNGLAANVITAAATASDFGAEIADAVWDEAIAGHLSAGTTGLALNSAGSAGDPWSTAVPGAYSAGTAGYIVGTNLNATVSSRASQTSVDTVDDFLDTEIAAIKAKTDNLPSDPADASDIASSFSSIASTLSTIAAYIDTEVAAIKAKTDNLPADPADASDIAASFSTVNSTLSTMAAYIDTEVAAIKAKTDSLTFTSAGFVDANVQKINDVTITGNGQTGTEFGV